MDYKRVFFLLLIISIIFSINSLSASELISDDFDDIATVSSFDDSYVNLNIEDDSNSNIVLLDNKLADSSSEYLSEDSSKDKSYDIYIGSNITENGNGSCENPYANFKLACDDVKSGKEKVNIYVFNGEYTIGSGLEFNVSNLHICGLGDNVTIKSSSNDGNWIVCEYFSLSTGGSFTLSNVIIKTHDPTGNTATKQANKQNSFIIFRGATELATFNNCTFEDAGNFLFADTKNPIVYKYLYNNCCFLGNNVYTGFGINNVTLNNSAFLESNKKFVKPSSFGNVIIFDSCLITDGHFNNNKDNFKIINSYSPKFSADITYFGSNSFQIVGNLSVEEGASFNLEKLPPIKISLTSWVLRTIAPVSKPNEKQYTNNNRKDLPKEVYLINGTFKLTYSSGSPVEQYESETYILLESTGDYDFVIDVTFPTHTARFEYNYANVSLDSPRISQGDDQNITITFSERQNGILYVNVDNNKTYNKTLDYQKEVIFNIPDALSEGTHKITVSFIDDESKIYGFNSTDLIVKEELKSNISLPEIVAGKTTTTTIKLPENATGNITVTVDGKEYSVVNLTNGSATITIPELPSGKHNVTISYSGDDNYEGFSQTSTVEVKEPAKETPIVDEKPVTFKKTATKITAKKKTFKAKVKVKKYTITLKAGKKAVKKVQVTLKIGKKTYKAKTNAKGKATFKINLFILIK